MHGVEIFAIAAVLHDREGVAGILEDDPEGAAEARGHLVGPANEIIRGPAHEDADAVAIGGEPDRPLPRSMSTCTSSRMSV